MNDQLQGAALATFPAEDFMPSYRFRQCRQVKMYLSRKPMALTIEDAPKMKKIAEETGRILMVGHLLEFHSCGS